MKIKKRVQSIDKTSFAFVSVLVLAGVLMRLIPHMPNFTPVGALALLGGAVFSKRLALVFPLLIMIVSDLIIGIHSVMVYTWGAFFAIALVGFYFLRGNLKVSRIIGSSIFASVLFYLVTNFGVWAEGRMYPLTIQGLLQSYIMAIPFFRNTLLGNLFYSGVFFGAYQLARFMIQRVVFSTTQRKENSF